MIRTSADLVLLAEVAELGLPLHVLDEARTPRWNAASGGVLQQIAEFAAVPHPGLDVVTPEALALPLLEIDAEARAAAAGFFGRGKRLAAVAERLAPVVRPEAAVKPKRLSELTGALVELQERVDALAGQVSAIPGLGLPPGWNPFPEDGRLSLARHVDRVRHVAHLVDPERSEQADLVGAVRRVIAGGERVDPRPVREVASALDELLQRCAARPDALAAWAGGSGLLSRWRETAAERALADPQLGSLRRWLELIDHLEPMRAANLDDARAALLTGDLRGGRDRRRDPASVRRLAGPAAVAGGGDVQPAAAHPHRGPAPRRR